MGGKRSLHSRELSVVNEVSKVLSGELPVEEALGEILKVLYSFWDVPYSFVALSDQSGRFLKIVKAFGLSDEEVERGIFKKGEGITGKVFKRSIPVVVSDIDSNPAFLNKTKIKDKLKGDETLIAVPVRSGGDTLGVLVIFKRFSKGESVERCVETLMIVGTMLGMFCKLNERLEKEKREWEEERRILTEELQKSFNVEGMVGKSEAFLKTLELVRKVAPTDSTVLLTGESGTGKSMIAKAIHFLSPRKDKPFITVNCGAIPENLLEAELFGYEKGAFTGAYTSKKGKFELANGGTLFLDEIGDMPLSLQVKLLRVLQDKEIERLGGEKVIKVDVRIVAATNKSLEDLVKEGKFREDLYYRLNVVPIRVPPLRERKEDIPLLVDYFLNKYNRQHKKNVRLTAKALDALIAYDWPGNIRELENTIQRIVVIHEGVVDLRDLPADIVSPLKDVGDDLVDLPAQIEATEREKIIQALEKTGYVKSRAAKLLGYTLRQLDYRIKKYKIPIKKF